MMTILSSKGSSEGKKIAEGFSNPSPSRSISMTIRDVTCADPVLLTSPDQLRSNAVAGNLDLINPRSLGRDKAPKNDFDPSRLRRKLRRCIRTGEIIGRDDVQQRLNGSMDPIVNRSETSPALCNTVSHHWGSSSNSSDPLHGKNHHPSPTNCYEEVTGKAADTSDGPSDFASKRKLFVIADQVENVTISLDSSIDSRRRNTFPFRSGMRHRTPKSTVRRTSVWNAGRVEIHETMTTETDSLSSSNCCTDESSENYESTTHALKALYRLSTKPQRIRWREAQITRQQYLAETLKVNRDPDMVDPVTRTRLRTNESDVIQNSMLQTFGVDCDDADDRYSAFDGSITSNDCASSEAYVDAIYSYDENEADSNGSDIDSIEAYLCGLAQTPMTTAAHTSPQPCAFRELESVSSDPRDLYDLPASIRIESSDVGSVSKLHLSEESSGNNAYKGLRPQSPPQWKGESSPHTPRPLMPSPRLFSIYSSRRASDLHQPRCSARSSKEHVMFASSTSAVTTSDRSPPSRPLKPRRLRQIHSTSLCGEGDDESKRTVLYSSEECLIASPRPIHSESTSPRSRRTSAAQFDAPRECRQNMRNRVSVGGFKASLRSPSPGISSPRATDISEGLASAPPIGCAVSSDTPIPEVGGHRIRERRTRRSSINADNASDRITRQATSRHRTIRGSRLKSKQRHFTRSLANSEGKHPSNARVSTHGDRHPDGPRNAYEELQTKNPRVPRKPSLSKRIFEGSVLLCPDSKRIKSIPVSGSNTAPYPCAKSRIHFLPRDTPVATLLGTDTNAPSRPHPGLFAYFGRRIDPVCPTQMKVTDPADMSPSSQSSPRTKRRSIVFAAQAISDCHNVDARGTTIEDSHANNGISSDDDDVRLTQNNLLHPKIKFNVLTDTEALSTEMDDNGLLLIMPFSAAEEVLTPAVFPGQAVLPGDRRNSEDPRITRARKIELATKARVAEIEVPGFVGKSQTDLVKMIRSCRRV